MRFRKDLGDIEDLKKSISEIGLIHPIVIDSNSELIAGERRLKACNELGIEPEYRIIDFDNPEQAQIDENIIRKDFTPSEIFSIQEYYNKKLSRPAGRPKKEIEKIQSESDRISEQPRDTVAKIVGQSTDTLSKINKIFKSNNEQVKNQVDEGVISINEGYKELRKQENIDNRQKVRERYDTEIELKGEKKYRIIYADPPWKYDKGKELSDHYGDVQKHYPPMETEDICNLPVSDMAYPDCVLFLWATAPKLPEALRVMESWGFKYKTCIIWDKIKHNFGFYFSIRHELLLIGGIGKSTPDIKKLYDSVVSIERSDKHSEKPKYFRELIDKMYFVPKGKNDRIELFARGELPKHWDKWGNE